MADHEEKKEPTPRGNEWEVVSLTSSAYAATPSSSELVDTTADMAYRIGKDEAMFMSGHFVFPPSQHENLPLEPEEAEVQNVPEIAQSSSRPDIKDEPHEFNNSIEKEHTINTDLKYSSFYDKSSTYDENTFIAEQMEPSEELLDSDMLNSLNKVEGDDVYDSCKLPSEAWWKRGASALYSQAKEANTFWTICVAAAVMGLVVMGRRLHQEKLEVLHLKWRLSIDTEKLKKLIKS